jgi:hypothetical protein
MTYSRLGLHHSTPFEITLVLGFRRYSHNIMENSSPIQGDPSEGSRTQYSALKSVSYKCARLKPLGCTDSSWGFIPGARRACEFPNLFLRYHCSCVTLAEVQCKRCWYEVIAAEQDEVSHSLAVYLRHYTLTAKASCLNILEIPSRAHSHYSTLRKGVMSLPLSSQAR